MLRLWRERIGRMSGREAARHLAVTASALNQWERGRRRSRRGIDVATLRRLDECYGAGGALFDLAMALGTPTGLAPRHAWAHNFPGPSGPVWAWLRPSPGARRIDASLRWGAFGLTIAEGCDHRGVFVTTTVSLAHPTVWVRLGAPGWVDFGRGEVPAALGLPCISARNRAEIAGGGHSGTRLVDPRLIDRFARDPPFAARLLAFFGSRPDLVSQVFTASRGDDRMTDLTGASEDPAPSPLPFTAEEHCRLRRARWLSRTDVARLATEMLPHEPVRDHHIELLENGGHPRPRRLLSRLDRIYRADGATCVEPVAPRPSTPVPTFEFPRYWIGPVWFRFASTTGTSALVTLQRGRSHKELRVRAPITITCRRSTDTPLPFVVTCPRGWTVAAGLGQLPGARDVNFGWLGSEPTTGQGGRRWIHEAFLEWFGRTPDELAALLDRENG
jgi:hypothetical protein